MRCFFRWLYCTLSYCWHQCILHSHRWEDCDTCVGDVYKECQHCIRSVEHGPDSPY
jgi:hypothetical protein